MPHSIKNRPLSPHLRIYRWQITSLLSITHRATGVALYFGSFLIVLWLCSAAYSAPLYAKLHVLMASKAGLFLLFCWTLAFFFHFANGLRHMWWDTGHGLALKEVSQSGWVVILFTFILTGLTWGLASQPLPSAQENAHAADTSAE